MSSTSEDELYSHSLRQFASLYDAFLKFAKRTDRAHPFRSVRDFYGGLNWSDSTLTDIEHAHNQLKKD